MGSFQDLLNRKNNFAPALDADGKPIPGTSTGIPSQYSGGGALFGIGRQPESVLIPLMNRAIPGTNMGNELGVAQGEGNFNIMNPFTYGNMNRAVEGTRAGDENIQYSDSPAGQVGEAANERNRLIQQLLEGS